MGGQPCRKQGPVPRPQIVWRDKEQFDEGSGAVDLLSQAVDRWMSPSEATHYARRHREARLRSAEECLYHKILCEAYPDPAPVLGNVARWADRPGHIGPARRAPC